MTFLLRSGCKYKVLISAFKFKDFRKRIQPLVTENWRVFALPAPSTQYPLPGIVMRFSKSAQNGYLENSQNLTPSIITPSQMSA